ncbi:MAG: hypothetical protein ACRDRY_21950 [Pseudonocardiaceae bacterium]
MSTTSAALAWRGLPGLTAAADRRHTDVEATLDSNGFANLVVSKRDGCIELDPHATGSWTLTLDEDEATALRDVLTEWLG